MGITQGHSVLKELTTIQGLEILETLQGRCFRRYDGLRHLMGELKTAHAQAQSTSQRVLRKLASRLIPGLEKEGLQALEQSLGIKGLLAQKQQLDHQHQQQKARLKHIQATPQYQKREQLTCSQQGEYTRQISGHAAEVQQLGQQLEIFEFQEFQWLYRRGFHQAEKNRGFQGFLRMVTLTTYREERARNAVATHEALGDFGHCVKHYESLKEQRKKQLRTLETWRRKRQAVLDLAAEAHHLNQRLAHYHEECLQQLRLHVTAYLETTSWRHIYRRLPAAEKPLIAQSAAYLCQAGYMQTIRLVLRTHIKAGAAHLRRLKQYREAWQGQREAPVEAAIAGWLDEVPPAWAGESATLTAGGRQIYQIFTIFQGFGIFGAFWDQHPNCPPLDIMAALVPVALPEPDVLASLLPEIGEKRKEYGSTTIDQLRGQMAPFLA